MENKFWKYYSYIRLPLTLIVVSVIIYVIFIYDKPGIFILLPFTILVIVLAILSFKLFLKQMKSKK